MLVAAPQTLDVNSLHNQMKMFNLWIAGWIRQTFGEVTLGDYDGSSSHFLEIAWNDKLMNLSISQ